MRRGTTLALVAGGTLAVVAGGAHRPLSPPGPRACDPEARHRDLPERDGLRPVGHRPEDAAVHPGRPRQRRSQRDVDADVPPVPPPDRGRVHRLVRRQEAGHAEGTHDRRHGRRLRRAGRQRVRREGRPRRRRLLWRHDRLRPGRPPSRALRSHRHRRRRVRGERRGQDPRLRLRPAAERGQDRRGWRPDGQAHGPRLSGCRDSPGSRAR